MNLSDIKTEQEFDANNQNEIWSKAAREICFRHNISYRELKRSQPCEHVVFFVDNSFVLKIFAPFRQCFERERSALEFAHGKTSLKIPEIVATGNFDGFDYMLQTQMPGELMTREVWLALAEKEQISILNELAVGLKQLHSHNADSFNFDWHKFIETQSKLTLQRQINGNVNREIIELLPEYIETNLKLLPAKFRQVFLHGDIHFGNLRLQKTNGRRQISGLFDFSDSLCGFHEFDFVAIGVLMIQGQGNLQREFFKSYGYSESDLDESFRKRLMLMTILYECSDLRRYALRLKPEAVNFSLDKLEKGIWSFLE